MYGGYFGAGIGILMLAGLSFAGLDDIHQMNATILHLLGIDSQRFSVKFQGLDVRLTGVEPVKPLQAILA